MSGDTFLKNDEYIIESSLSDRKCQSEISKIVDGLQLSTTDSNYLLSMPNICTWFYILGCWLDDADARVGLGYSVAMHCFGIKLLDDIVDDDTPCSHAGLMTAGTLVCDAAHREMVQFDMIEHFFRYRPGVWTGLWRDQFDLDLMPSERLEDWLLFAEKRTGRLLDFYAGFLSQHESHKLDEATICETAMRIANIWSVFDDCKDVEKDRIAGQNRHTNLRLMIERGSLSKAAVFALLQREQDFIMSVVRRSPPCLNFQPFLENVIQRCRNFLDQI